MSWNSFQKFEALRKYSVSGSISHGSTKLSCPENLLRPTNEMQFINRKQLLTEPTRVLSLRSQEPMTCDGLLTIGTVRNMAYTRRSQIETEPKIIRIQSNSIGRICCSIRDGLLEKFCGGGEFSSRRNFFSSPNSLYEDFFRP